MDNKMQIFRNNSEMHNQVVLHLIKKKVPRNQAVLFYQPETWWILADKIEKGEYHFQPLTEGYVDKRTGLGMNYTAASDRGFEDVRKIYMLTPMDRAVMHMIYLIYYKMYIKFTSPLNVSYKSGIGTSKVAIDLNRKMNSMEFFDGYKLDIHHYFDDVNMQTIEDNLAFMNPDSPLDVLLWEIYHDDRVIVNGKMTHRHRGLIQGCAFACLLANLCLRDIDFECSKLNIIYYRYSDDIIVLGNKTDVAKAIRIVNRKLEEKGLSIHPDKFKPVNAKDDWFEFLGFSHHRNRISVSSKTLGNLVKEIDKRTINITHEQKRPATKSEIKKMVSSLQNYFFTAYEKNKNNFGMGQYLFDTVNVEEDIKEIEFYIRDCLRACYCNNTKGLYSLGYSTRDKDYKLRNHVITHGCGNGKKKKWLKGEDVSNIVSCPVAENKKKTHSYEFEGGDLLIECGWVSLIHLYRMYHTDKDVYKNEILKISNHTNVII